MGQVLGLTVVFSPWLLLAIFVMTLLAEFGVSVPLLMESVWLFTGYTFTNGTISAEHLAMYVGVGLVGRLIGGIAVFYLVWYGKTFVGAPVFRFLRARAAVLSARFHPLQRVAATCQRGAKWATSRTSNGTVSDSSGSHNIRLLGRSFRMSPVTIACGRFIGLRWPLTVFLGARHQRTKLLLGIAIFSIVWDAAYITFGVIGGKSGLDQMQMVFYPIGAVVVISGVMYGIKRLRAYLKTRRTPRVVGIPGPLCCPLPRFSTSAYPLALRTPDGIGSSDNP